MGKRGRYRQRMDHAWAAERLRDFRGKIDLLKAIEKAEGEEFDDLVSSYGPYDDVADRLVSLDPVMRDLMEAAQPGLGSYQDTAGGWSYQSTDYWQQIVRDRVLRAIGIHELGEEARRRMRPDSPDLAADQLHPWVWEAAAPLWHAGSAQAAVLAAAQSVNARLQQKLGRHDASDAALCREAFSRDDPAPRRPRLRFPGDRASDTWRSRQNGAVQFGAGCFEGLRNPAAHEHELELPDQVALEQLAAFSVLARWIEECTVETGAAQGIPEEPGSLSQAPGR
jgi:hypothetical protein